VGQLTPALWAPDGKLWVARVKERVPAEALTFEARHKLVESIQGEAAGRILQAEMRALEEEGRKHSGFSSLWGRLNGIWINEEQINKAGKAAGASEE
jgi:hypothetical protein